MSWYLPRNYTCLYTTHIQGHRYERNQWRHRSLSIKALRTFSAFIRLEIACTATLSIKATLLLLSPRPFGTPPSATLATTTSPRLVQLQSRYSNKSYKTVPVGGIYSRLTNRRGLVWLWFGWPWIRTVRAHTQCTHRATEPVYLSGVALQVFAHWLHKNQKKITTLHLNNTTLHLNNTRPGLPYHLALECTFRVSRILDSIWEYFVYLIVSERISYTS